MPMLKIDNSLLQEVGLGALPETEKNSFLKHIYETLEMRVGIRLADQMSNEQLDEFEKYFEAKDDAGAFKWLETNFPNYKEIVQQEFDKLKAEVAQSAPQIIAASQAQAAQAAAAVPPAAAPQAQAGQVPAGQSWPPAETTQPATPPSPAFVQAPATPPYAPAQPQPAQPAPGQPAPFAPPAGPAQPQAAPPEPTAQPYQNPSPQPPAASPEPQTPFPSQQPPAGPQ